MICSMCGKYINKKVSISNIFDLDFICDSCAKEIELKLSIFPLNNGYLAYYYYYLIDNNYIDKINYKLYKLLYDFLKKTKNTVIFINQELIDFLPYLDFHENIVFISIKYIELERYVDI